MLWHFPSASGDYTLIPDGDSAVRLEVVNPTADELTAIGNLLKEARRRGWCGDAIGISPIGVTNVTIGTTMAKAAPLLMAEAYKGERSLTMVTSKAGTIKTVFDDQTPALTERITEAIEVSEDAPPEKKPKKIVTAVKPKVGCPIPQVSKLLRASNVLHSVCTQEQWASWLRNGWLFARGGVSGLTYRVAHRHSRAANAQGRVVWCCETSMPVCLWNNDLPPAEEVATIKLVLEHREPWIIDKESVDSETLRHLQGNYPALLVGDDEVEAAGGGVSAAPSR